jgi:hypothetical protein
MSAPLAVQQHAPLPPISPSTPDAFSRKQELFDPTVSRFALLRPAVLAEPFHTNFHTDARSFRAAASWIALHTEKLLVVLSRKGASSTLRCTLNPLPQCSHLKSRRCHSQEGIPQLNKQLIEASWRSVSVTLSDPTPLQACRSSNSKEVEAIYILLMCGSALHHAQHPR